ncbi:DEAD/DEAH box helicase [Aspergillus novofumigatus IBT 16806]|uniref:Putative dsDNA-dependent ATPase n=1 Tax=Aspergillus novofumigatus (strain IBT 16806) TaxID=1392255 RepID=A0A2I1C852_ASPN1|nr:putative dsDNA-dependent ATPase [Aspergillus novofumigatus IBT 16806]PKX93818.1 putative dsDNA-dependent ATPase [Aspergillus novofumigatus IBT 16806]
MDIQEQLRDHFTMVFKPFKPPLIRKQPNPSVSDPPPASGASEHREPPAKKQRLNPEISAHGDSLSRSYTLSRKPLQQVINAGSSSSESTTGDDPHGDRYYNVLWRKPSTKKNKTWDGDGIISASDGYLYLQDISGKDMGRVMHGPRLEIGTVLSIGGKEVEIDSEIPRKEYLARRPFLERKDTTGPVTAPAAPKKTFTPLLGNRSGTSLLTTSSQKSQGGKTGSLTLPNPASRPSSIYKRPLLESTVPVPRHDPNQPGALVMKRPDSVPKGKQIVDVVVDPILSKHLRQHQREGVQFLYECVMGMRSFNGEGAILADDMGLGKTLQTITLLWTLLKQNPIHESPPVIKKALIVCPVTLINNWRKEFRKWLGNERIGIFVFDDKRKRLTDFTMGRAYSVMIVGYEKLRTVQEGLARGAGVDIIIADEGHRLKTLQNKSGQAIQSLNATKRIILSGTPIQNDLKEFFAAVDLVNPGILGNFKAFVREFEGPIVKSRQPEATKKEIEKGEARNEELRELTSKFMLRRTADVLAKYLPPKTEYVLFCNPTSTQANIYKNVLASPVFQCAIGNSENALQLITILKKLCNSPSLLSPKTGVEKPSETITALLSSLPPNLLRHFSPSCSAKIRVLDQLLHNLRTSTSEKIVLVSNYTATLNLLANLLTSLSLPFLRLDGSTPAQKRQALVEDFNRLPPNLCFAFLLSAKAGGTGLNLIGASRLVLFDVDWNPATDVQAMARIHRDGQKRHCRIYRVLLKGSLEEKIWQRQVTKIGLADSVMEHKNSVAQFSRDELKDLFRLDEASRCQTHELLGCDCGGLGQMAGPSSNDTSIPATDAEDSPPSELSDTDSEFPDIPTLIKASQLNMEEQERRIRSHVRDGRRTGRNKGKRGNDSTGDEPAKQSRIQQSLSHYVHIDPVIDLQAALDDDDVLLPLLKDEDNRSK